MEVNVNEPQYLDYSIDEKNYQINLGKINNTDLSVRYSFNKTLDAFSLFFKDETFDEAFFQTLGIGSSGDPSDTEQKPMSAFTKAFLDKFKAGFKDLMKGLPIAAGKRMK